MIRLAQTLSSSGWLLFIIILLSAAILVRSFLNVGLRSRSVRISMFAGVAIPASIIFVFVVASSFLDWPCITFHTRSLRLVGSVLDMDADLGPRQLRNVTAYILLNHVSTLNIASPGGRADSMEKLRDIMNAYKVGIVVENRNGCGSACVGLFIGVHTHNAGEDAVFGFHKGKHLKSFFDFGSEFNPAVMLDWAKQISPEMVRYFSNCAVAPTDREQLFQMSWTDIKAVVGGHPLRSCDAQAKIDYHAGW